VIVAKGLALLGASNNLMARWLVKRKHALALCLAGASLSAFLLWLPSNDNDRALGQAVAYVVCGDQDFHNQKIYKVDLIAGGRLGVSEPIDWMGNPTQLAIDRKRSRLYIGSFRGKARDYYPVTVVSVEDDEFEVVEQFTTNLEDVLPRDSSRLNKKPHEVYQIAVSPDGNELYVMHGGMSEGMLGAVWDAGTGNLLRELERPVQQADIWSPDGQYVARVMPSRERKREQDGRITVERIPARVDVLDVLTGRRVSLAYPENGKMLHPPWGHAEGPLVRVRGSGSALAYDRDSGEVVSDFNVDQLTGLSMFAGVTWYAPPVLDDHRTIVLSMYDSHASRVFVVAIDALKQTEVSRTQVGARCTNAVVAYE